MLPADSVDIAKAAMDAKAAGKACWNICNRHGSRTLHSLPPIAPQADSSAGKSEEMDENGNGIAPAIDRTVKLYIGGKQARPDSGYSMEVRSAGRTFAGRSSARQPQRHSQCSGGRPQSGGLGKSDRS